MTSQVAQIADLFARHPEQLASMRWLDAERVPDVRVEMYTRLLYLEPDECAAFIAKIESGRRPSTIADHNGDYRFRTSETCDMFDDDPLVAVLNARLSLFCGIAPGHGEPLQGQRYAVGQEFKHHTDYFAPDGRDYQTYCSVSGQRTWTAMIYLNTPEAGGETDFKHLGRSFAPQAGRIVCWNNRRADGSVNPMTLHAGRPVIAGVKYVLTKWYRELPWG